MARKINIKGVIIPNSYILFVSYLLVTIKKLHGFIRLWRKFLETQKG